MNAETTKQIIVDGITDYSAEMFVIVGSVVVIIVAFLVLKVGLYRLFNDKSLEIGGYYFRNTPYKGYNRFRSKKWNMEHTM